MHVEIGQIISQIISFLIMLWILKRYAWKPILKLMDDRQNKIKSQFDEIENQKKQLSIQMKEYQEKINDLQSLSNGKIREAVDKGQQMAQEILQKARNQAKTMIEGAQEDAQHELIKARKLLKDELVNLTITATEKILKTDLNKEKQKQLILDFINHTELN